MSAPTLSVVNGLLPHTQAPVDEVAEWTNLIKLHDVVFAGTHPRLTVRVHDLRKVSPASNATQLSSHSSLPVQPLSAQLPPPLPGLTLTQDGDQPRPPQAQPAPTASGIDPALLTKSDALIRAETAMQRGRLEKNLRDQFEQKRLDFRKRPAPAEAKPDFDLRAVLAKALEAVKPVSLSKDPSDKEGENDSFDENSFYSSRAPDSTPERGDGFSADDDPDPDPSAAIPPHTAVRRVEGPSYPSSQTQAFPAGPAQPATPFATGEPHPADVDDDDEEGEYSPPEADPYPSQSGPPAPAMPDSRSRHVGRYSDLDETNKRPASPSDPHLRIVRNHITSPHAPQPSRVSPLALTKDALVSQARQQQNGRPRGRAESPSQSPEPIASRNKRRKLDRKEQKRSRRIKQENISPPPFHDIQPLGANKNALPDDRPIVIDDPPQPPEIRYAPAPRYIASPQRPTSRQAEYVPMSEPRVMSRASMRPRDDQDLRRVASMHSMRVEPPRDYVEYAPPTQPRATSYMRVDSPMRDMGSYGSEHERPLQEIRIVRTPAPEYRDIYQPEPEVRYIPEPMPPPPRERIVVDQYGRRFREIVQERAPVSMTQRSASAHLREGAPYYENYTPARAGSVLLEERPSQYEPEMPPLRVVQHVPDQLRQGSSPTRGHAPRDGYEQQPSATGRAASVAVFERPAPPRQVVYADATEYRPPPRMSSVRPPPAHYDEQPVMQVPRAGSVRPGPVRESSGFVNDRPGMRREYLPVEQPRYRVLGAEPMAPPPPQTQTRYVDAQGREVLPPAQEDGGVSYVQRY